MQFPKSLVLAIFVLIIAALVSIFAYGVSAQRYRLFPYDYFDDIETAINWFLDRRPGTAPWYYIPTDKTNTVAGKLATKSTEGLNLITAMGPDDMPIIKVINMAGEAVHEWPVNWFDIWPDPQHVRLESRPKSKPGGHIHGIAMLDDGSIVFNFENLSMVRMNFCGEVLWKLPYRTHHSIFVDDDGNIWAPAQRFHEQKLAAFPNHSLPVSETMILKVSPEGNILREISMFEWFDQRNLRGWLHLGAEKKTNVVSGDVLHMNDVEIFPNNMTSDFFSPGDIMISLRNINSVMVLDRDTLDIKYWKTDELVRQHDPDFMGGNRISIYDNNRIGPKDGGQQSRIIVDDVDAKPSTIAYTGSPDEPFYSRIMGKHQWLPNGNLLVTDSMNGRAIEIGESGQILWEFVNIVAEGKAGLVEELQRLPASYSQLFGADVCASS